MSSISSQNENEFFHRQGSVTSLPDEEDQITIASDLSVIQQDLSSSSLNRYPQVPNLDNIRVFNDEKEYQTASIDLQTVPDINIDDNINQNWEQLSGDVSPNNQRHQNVSQSDTTDDITTSFGFQQQPPDQTESLVKEINFTTDYQTFVRSQKLYFDPNPELIRKPQMITPLIYKQNIMIKFLKPPSVPLGPLIIREVRPPQPPPPPPLVSPKLISFFIKLYFKIDYPSTSSTSSFTTTYYSS